MTQEQYNRYMDGLVLKVASKRPFGKVASFVRKHAAVDGRAQVASGIAALERKFGKGIARKAMGMVPDNKPAVDYYKQYNDERAQVANDLAELGRQYGKGMALQARSVIPDNKTETDNNVNELNEKTNETESQHRVNVANATLDALHRTKAMTEKAIKKINDSNEAIHRKEMKTPEVPWYSKAYEWVKANPKTSLAIGGGALAGGLLLAYLMRKKEKDAKKQKATKKHKFIVGNSSLAFA